MIKLEARSDGGKIYLISLIYLTAPIRLDFLRLIEILALVPSSKISDSQGEVNSPFPVLYLRILLGSSLRAHVELEVSYKRSC